MFKQGCGNWTQYRKLPGLVEVDFHYAELGQPEVPYWETMGDIRVTALEALKRAFEEGTRFVLFRHGWSTSRPGNTTARSQVRGLMRSPDATPYIVRKQCIQRKKLRPTGGNRAEL